jgi:hypothetical protein
MMGLSYFKFICSNIDKIIQLFILSYLHQAH